MPIVVIAGFVVVLLLLERQHQSIAARAVSAPSNTAAPPPPLAATPIGTGYSTGSSPFLNVPSATPSGGGTVAEVGGVAGAGAGVAGGVVGLSSGLSAGTIGLGAAIPIVGGIAAGVIAITEIFLSGHNKRVAGAKNENDAMMIQANKIKPAVQQIFADLNLGRTSPATAIGQLEQIRVSYWASMEPYQHQPGQAVHACTPNPGGACDRGDGYGSTKCDKTCTASCCIGCGVIEPGICNAKRIIAAGGGTMKWQIMIGDPKYTKQPMVPAFTLTYNGSAAAHALHVNSVLAI